MTKEQLNKQTIIKNLRNDYQLYIMLIPIVLYFAVFAYKPM